MIDTPIDLIASAVGQDKNTSTWIFAMVCVFVLSLGLSLIRNTALRKWYSTSIGLFFGFQVNGLGYIFVLLMFVAVYPIVVVLPRRQASVVGSLFALLMLSLGNFYVWYLGVGKTEFVFVFQNMQNFIKIHMTLVNYRDAEKLQDKEKAKELTDRERYHAEVLREFPSFADWCHYHMVMLTSTLGGPPTEYRPYIEFINLESDVREMKPFSNFWPAIKRFMSVLACMAAFSAMITFVDKNVLIDPQFKQEAFWFRTV